VDDARTLSLLPARDRAAEQAVHEGAAGMARRRMNHHARRLVHHEQVLVFEGHPER